MVFRRIFKILYIVLSLSLISLSAYALEVQQVRFGVHPEKVRMVLDLSEVTDFRAFVLSDPYRMVIDLPTFAWRAGRVEKPKQAMISDIRQGGLMPGVSRIVFDMGQPALIDSAFLLPKQGEKQNRIVVDYRLVDGEEFTKLKNVVHGTLKIEDYKGTSAGTQNGVPVPPDNTARPKYASAEKPLIIIDPGHGGNDPGAIGHNKAYEKHVVLAMAKELRKQLQETGKYRVMLTREKDIYIRLKDRVKFARDQNADLFISLHADSIHKKNVHGTSIYTLSQKASDQQTARLAEKENQADLIAGVGLSVEDEQVAFILGDFLMNDTMNQSKFFANTLVSKLKTNGIYLLENPHRYAGFAVLKAPDVPSVLIEAGFMSNRKEADLLNQPAHRKKMAASIARGIDAYFDHVYKNEQN